MLCTDGALQACGLRLAIAAFGTGALLVDALVERTVAIQRHPHLPAQFPIEVFDAALLLEKRLLVAGLPRGVGKEQGAAKCAVVLLVTMPTEVGATGTEVAKAPSYLCSKESGGQ